MLYQYKNRKSKNLIQEKEIKELKDVINFCSEKSLNIRDFISNKVINKNLYFLYDYPKWLSQNNGENEIKKYNGGVNINFYISKEKKLRLMEAIKVHNYKKIDNIHMKLLEVLHTEDLFYDISYNNDKKSNSKSSQKDRAITSWSLES
jgi:hypothetical protein